LELGSRSLAAEHSELVAQDEELQVLGGVAAAEQGEQLDQAAQREVEESRSTEWPLSWELGEHSTESRVDVNPQVTASMRVSAPYGHRVECRGTVVAYLG